MRGQTTLDFAIGVSVFLVVILFVFSFVPGIVAPFTEAEEDHTVNVGRIADTLASDALGDPKQPYVLDPECTATFFNTSSSGCGFSSSESVPDRVGIEPGTAQVQVVIEGDINPATGTETLCWNGDAVVEDPCGGRTLKYNDGVPSNNAAVISATRVVNLAGHAVTLRVVMW